MFSLSSSFPNISSLSRPALSHNNTENIFNPDRRGGALRFNPHRWSPVLRLHRIFAVGNHADALPDSSRRPSLSKIEIICNPHRPSAARHLPRNFTLGKHAAGLPEIPRRLSLSVILKTLRRVTPPASFRLSVTQQWSAGSATNPKCRLPPRFPSASLHPFLLKSASADSRLDVFIYDYFVRRDLKATAQAFQIEGKVSSDPVGFLWASSCGDV